MSGTFHKLGVNYGVLFESIFYLGLNYTSGLTDKEEEYVAENILYKGTGKAYDCW